MRLRWMGKYRAVLLYVCGKAFGIVFNLWEGWRFPDGRVRWFGFHTSDDHSTLMLGIVSLVWDYKTHQIKGGHHTP